MVFQTNTLLSNLFDHSTRVSAFIDDEYFRIGAEELLGGDEYKLEEIYSRLSRLTKGQVIGTINRIYFYTALIAQDDDALRYAQQEERLKTVSAIPLVDINRGRVTGRRGNRRQKKVDVQLATDMVLLAAKDTYDLALLIAGDTDFVDAVQAVKDLDKHVGILAFSPSASEELRRIGDFYNEITEEFLTLKDLPPQLKDILTNRI